MQFARSPQFNEHAASWFAHADPAFVDHLFNYLAVAGGLNPDDVSRETRMAFVGSLYQAGQLGAVFAQVIHVLTTEPGKFGFQSADHALSYMEEHAPILDEDGFDVTRREVGALQSLADDAYLQMKHVERAASHDDPDKRAAEADAWADAEIERWVKEGWPREKAVQAIREHLLEPAAKASAEKSRRAALEKAYAESFGPSLEQAEAALAAGADEGAFTDAEIAQFRANLYQAARLTGEIPDEGRDIPLGSRRAMLNAAYDATRMRQARELGLPEPVPTSTVSQIRSSDGRVTSLAPTSHFERVRGRRASRGEALREAWYENGGGQAEFEQAWPEPPSPDEYAARDERIQSHTASRREVLEAVYTGTMPTTTTTEREDASDSDSNGQ